MGKAFDVSVNIGFDGFTYFCKRCGKAGYERPTQVRGHLAMCPGTLMRKGVASTTGYNQLPTGNGAGLAQQPANQLQPVTSGSDGGLGGGQLLQPLAVVDPVANSVANLVGYEQLVKDFAMMKNQVENHQNHLMQSINQPQYRPAGQGFFDKYKGLLVVGAIILFAFILSEQFGKCQGSAGDKSSSTGDIGAKALTKLIDVGVTKGIGSLLK